MKKSRYSEEQIIGFLKQAEAGIPIKDLCRKGGFSDATFYKWRSKNPRAYAGLLDHLRAAGPSTIRLKRRLRSR